MRDLSKAISLIKKWEGFSGKAYLDPVGIPTIGYGTTKWPSGKNIKLGDVIKEHQAAELLEKHIERNILTDLNQSLSVQINDNQYNALVSFTYNVGIGAFIKSTMRRKINEGDFNGAAKEFPRWKFGSGKVLKGLTNRRKDERELFETPMGEIEKPSKILSFWDWLLSLFGL